ncbi:hypothetical protein [Enterococcus phage vB_EfaP_IME195]|uniref:Uncharacterized protein n=1 Tax=Enterococcus phage vB_EfaP_IME195 TaxID=1747288 RepID=A0A0S2MY43_9CAUD|nr:hypothetical protein AU087_p08 [Enterococcus phage vB_EfaP_IME195]ALO80853.1 hypothetical protein [Enterococcus phage vB_EfaP_IME195]
MLREKECNLKPRIYKVEYLRCYNDLVHGLEKYYKAETSSDATHKWLSEYQNDSDVKFIRCTEVPIQWN